MTFDTLRIFWNLKLNNGKLNVTWKVTILVKYQKTDPKTKVSNEISNNDFPLFILHIHFNMPTSSIMGWQSLGNIFSFYSFKDLINQLKTSNMDFSHSCHFSL